MSQNIIIIGGGISGLALLHYLKQRYGREDGVNILLLEKDARLGGTIRSIQKDGNLFETGPNGFLDSKPRASALMKELGLEGSLARADQASKVRYLSVQNTLHAFPLNPRGFLSFKLLTPFEKLRVFGEWFVPKGRNPDESVYDFGKRRFGEQFARVFLDPMVSGIYGGDARRVILRTVFPKIYHLEQEHGSLFKALVKTRRVQQGREGSALGVPAGTLTAPRQGMARLIEAIGTRYREHVLLNQDVVSVAGGQHHYRIRLRDGRELTADDLFVCAPAYSAGPMLKGVSEKMAAALGRIDYAPLAVVGLVVPLKCLAARPKGYGYLVPSSERKEVLGVLFESNIFPGRCGEDRMLFRVMVGGARHPRILNKTQEELVGLALNEITLGTGAGGRRPVLAGEDVEEVFFTPWERAIPQYDLEHRAAVDIIEEELRGRPRLHLVANYWKGVSLNDCIENAYQAARLL
jgi:oxygen-dependent protoporphyrinogen oxidase